jgi:hypothetical protein
MHTRSAAIKFCVINIAKNLESNYGRSGSKNIHGTEEKLNFKNSSSLKITHIGVVFVAVG